MMLFWPTSRCHTCKLPLCINMTSDYAWELMYWLLWQEMTGTNLARTNYVCHKRVGKKWIKLCIDCFKGPKSKFRHALQRETSGQKFTRPPRTVKTDQEIDFLIRSMIEYEKEAMLSSV